MASAEQYLGREELAKNLSAGNKVKKYFAENNNTLYTSIERY